MIVDSTGTDLYVTRNDTFRKPWGALEEPIDINDPGGRPIEDLILTDGSTTATSATAVFVENDTDRKIVVADGVGVIDGTTMLFVDETTIELSAPATETRTNVLAFLRPINLTAFDGGHVAQIRKKRLLRTGTVPAPEATFAIDETRSAVGIIWFSLTSEETTSLGANWVYDWQVTGPEGKSTWLDGKIILRKDSSRGG